jgi:hypothetical protein
MKRARRRELGVPFEWLTENVMAKDQQPQRRPINCSALEAIAARMKLRSGIELPPGPARTVPVPRDSFVPVVQANVGNPMPISVFRYRLLLPTVRVVVESATSIRRVTIATNEDVKLIERTLIRHFGGVTLLHQESSPRPRRRGARPADVLGTSELNEHAVFEVYAAPVQESDDYFRALRKELEEALLEGVILIERQEVTLL